MTKTETREFNNDVSGDIEIPELWDIRNGRGNGSIP